MKKTYEVEVQRSNISPKQFFSYCKRQLEKRGGVSLECWCDSFEDWRNGIDNCNSRWEHNDWEEPAVEVCKMLSYDWQLFLSKNYNFIMEFQFDSENKGFGYMYAVEWEK